MSSEISTAGTVPLFSSQWRVAVAVFALALCAQPSVAVLSFYQLVAAASG